MSYKRSVWGSCLLLAAAAAPVSAAGLVPALRLLAELPPASLEPGGEMREAARWGGGGGNVLELSLCLTLARLRPASSTC